MKIAGKLWVIFLPLLLVWPVLAQDAPELNKKVENLSQALDAESSYLDRVAKEVKSLQTEKKDLNACIDKLTAALNEKEKSIAKLDAAAKAKPVVIAAQVSPDNAGHEKNNLDNELKKVKSQLESKTKEIEDLKDKLSRSQDPFKEVKEKLRVTLAEKENLESELNKANQRLARKDKDEAIQKVTREKGDWERKFNEAQEQIKRLQGRLSEVERALEKRESTKSGDSAQVKKLRNELTEKEKTIEDLRRKLAQAPKKIEVPSDPNLVRELTEKEQEISQLKTVIKKSIERINALSLPQKSTSFSGQ